MKALLLLAALTAAPVTTSLTAQAQTTYGATEATTDTYVVSSKTLARQLASAEKDAQVTALQTIILHPKAIDADAVKFELVTLYRSHKDNNMRLMALSALDALQDPWTMDFLMRSIPFEKDERVARMTRYVAYSYFHPELVPDEAEAVTVLANR